MRGLYSLTLGLLGCWGLFFLVVYGEATYPLLGLVALAGLFPKAAEGRYSREHRSG